VFGVEVEGQGVALYLIGEQAYATSDECPHAQCLLSQAGYVDGEEVECTCHGSRFRIDSGANVAPPATEALVVYPVTIEGGDVLVDL
jgi:biphenyl 2,3-dioxygenase ferredoxin subunit